MVEDKEVRDPPGAACFRQPDQDPLAVTVLTPGVPGTPRCRSAIDGWSWFAAEIVQLTRSPIEMTPTIFVAFQDRQMSDPMSRHQAHAFFDGMRRAYPDEIAGKDFPDRSVFGGFAQERDFTRIIAFGEDAYKFCLDA